MGEDKKYFCHKGRDCCYPYCKNLYGFLLYCCSYKSEGMCC